MQESYTELTALNTTLTTTNTKLAERVNALKGVDEKLANAREIVKQLQLAQSNLNFVAPVEARPSPNHPNPDKFNRDKTKLETFVTQLCIKLQQNADHFVRPGQNTEQNQLSYVIFCLEGDVFL